MNVFLQNSIADTYDDYYLSEMGAEIDAIEKQIIGQLMSGIQPGDLLELGCGTGHWTEFFIQQGHQLTAIDASKAMLAYAHQKRLKAQLLEANVEALPFADAHFPVAASITMLEFVDDPTKAISEIHRVLKPSGFLIMGCLNGKSVLGMNKMKDEVFQHANFLAPSTLLSTFKGFNVVKTLMGVHLDSSFQLLDGKKNQPQAEPVFMGVLLKKT